MKTPMLEQIEKNTGAIFSADRYHRLLLYRNWDFSLRPICVIGLNPSTADETIDDPTIRRCCGFAKSWGYGGLRMVNLFSIRATDPRDMMIAEKPIHANCDDWIKFAVESSDFVLAAWGAHGAFRGRGKAVLGMVSRIKPVYVLGLTKKDQPKHPLYIRADQQPRVWR